MANSIIPTLLQLVGFLLLAIVAFMVSLLLGLTVVGVECLVVGLALERPVRGRNSV